MWHELVIIAVRGAGLGAVYALIAMSYNIVNVSSGILNFAQGAMLVLGGVLASVLEGALGGGFAAWLLGLVLTSVVMAMLLTLQGVVTLIPLGTSTDQQSWLITTMAVSIVIGAVLLLSVGPNALHARGVFPRMPLFGMRVPAPFGLSIGLALFWYVALRVFMTRSLAGLAIGALWQNPVAARAAGLRVRRLQLTAFAMSGLIVGSAAFVAAPILSLSADSVFPYALNGFVAAVIGGISSNAGALIAGPLVGIVGTLVAFRIGGEFQQVTTMVLLVAVLALRPQGLLGDLGARRV